MQVYYIVIFSCVISQNCITYDIYWYTFECLSLFGLFPNSAYVTCDVSSLIGQLTSFSVFWKKHGLNISHFYFGGKFGFEVGSLAKGAAPHAVTTTCLSHYIER